MWRNNLPVPRHLGMSSVVHENCTASGPGCLSRSGVTVSTCFNYRAVLHPIAAEGVARLVTCAWCAHPQTQVTHEEATADLEGASRLACRGESTRCQLG
jgi:hypothetical protein